MTFDEIQSAISDELVQFQKIFDTAFNTKEEYLKSIMKHVQKQKGKQIRPIFILLCAKICGTPTLSTYQMASALELLHTASLIHDDVVDNTDMRRGQQSVNNLFDNKTAILVGDYLLSKALNFAAETDSSQQNKFLAALGVTLSRGELLQLQHSYSIPAEEDYIDIIRKKTAILFETCAKCAALSVGATQAQTDALVQYADALGICFQIKDDIFDYTPDAQIGKPTLNDIREGKITLPLLHALRQMSHSDASRVLEAVKNNQFTEDFFYNIGVLIARYNGIEYASNKIEDYAAKGIEALAVFEDSEMKETLKALLRYVINRTK